jgi:hypothetical protein
MSRGYDGPEIDDFRDSGWGHEHDSSNRHSSRERPSDWQTRTTVKLKLQKVRDAETESDELGAQSRLHSEGNRSIPLREGREPEPKELDREKYTGVDRAYSLRVSEIHTMTEVGKFRVVGVEDLAKLAYAGDQNRIESDLRNLARQGLVELRGTSALKRNRAKFLLSPNKGSV